MKKSSILLILFLCASSIGLKAQEKKIGTDYKKSSITALNKLMNDFYVFPEIAKKTGKHLDKLMLSGHFDSFTDLKSFADALTEAVQSVNKDKHMRIRANGPKVSRENTVSRLFEDHLQYKTRVRPSISGFQEAKKLAGNIGYLDLRGFAGVGHGALIADNYMKLLSTSDAIIIDLRKNGGGDPNMVQYLCSYFFEGKVHLNSLYFRDGDGGRTEEFWTLDEVKGEKMLDIPLFVLTSPRTFSGAEEFSYNMQNLKRATLIGETTGGGANPGGTRPINGDLSVFIPTGKAISPITGTNWEGVGVVPEVKTTTEAAYEKGIELATIAAAEYRAKKAAGYKSILKTLTVNLAALSNDVSESTYKVYAQKVYENLKAGTETELFKEEDINYFGYDLLNAQKKAKAAEAIFKANILLFPMSANVYDSYGEVLAMNKKVAIAIENYEKAVKVALKMKDPQLALYKENLERVKKMK